MRVIIGVAFGVITVCVFVAVTVAVFIVEHIFAITFLAALVAAALLVHHHRRSRRHHFGAHPPANYPASLAQTPARPGLPQWAAPGMSSAALRSRAHRSLPPPDRRSYL
jgi:hypothetical protein